MDIELYDFQTASVEALRNNIRGAIKNQILSAATGSGKTIIAAHLMKEAYNKKSRTIFIADRINLIDQTSAVLDRYGIPHGVIQAQHYRFHPWEYIQVASAATLERRTWPEDTKLIIVDECHAMRKQVLRRIEKRDCIVLGLTATPFSKGLGKYYDAVVTVTTTNRLIERGYLCNYRVFAASEPDMTGAKTVAGEWTDEVAAERSMPIVGDCVAEYLKHGDGKKFIAFCVNVAHCEEMQKQFLAAGVRCELYTYRTPDEDRAQMIRDLQGDTELRGLITVSALSKGFDNHKIEVLIIARPLKSSFAEHIQILGRGLRSDPDNPAKVCTVLDHAGNTVRFWGEMMDFFENGASDLDDGKHKEKKKPEKKEAKPMKCPKCSTVHNPLPKCPSCGHIYARPSNVETVAGALIALEKTNAATRDEKQEVWEQFLFVARERGYKQGWAAHLYKQRFGVWPRNLVDIEREPTQKVLNYIRSRQIAYSKGKKSESSHA